MPKTTNPQTPGAILQSLIDKYEINPNIVSKSLNVAYQSVTNILKGEARISAQMALRLAAYFGNTPEFWLNIQNSSEIEEYTSNSKFMSALKKIPKVEKGTGRKSKRTTAKPKAAKKNAKVKSVKKVKKVKTGRPAKK